LSALLNGPIDQAGPRLVSVLRDQNYLAVSPAEQIVALAAFRLPLDTGGVQLAPSVMVPSVIVTDDMLIALADDIIERTARLALIDKDNNPDLYGMAKKSLAVRTQKYSEWAADFRPASLPHQAPVTPLSRAAGRSRSPPAIPHCARAASHRMVSMATLSDESDHDAQLYLDGSSGLNASVALSSFDMCFLLSSSAFAHPMPSQVQFKIILTLKNRSSIASINSTNAHHNYQKKFQNLNSNMRVLLLFKCNRSLQTFIGVKNTNNH
jgi:hypothetical protein